MSKEKTGLKKALEALNIGESLNNIADIADDVITFKESFVAFDDYMFLVYDFLGLGAVDKLQLFGEQLIVESVEAGVLGKTVGG